VSELEEMRLQNIEDNKAFVSIEQHVNSALMMLLPFVVRDWSQGDHLSGKPRNVREFDSCQGNVREKILSGKSCLKLFIVSYRLKFDAAALAHVDCCVCRPMMSGGGRERLGK